MAEVLVVEELPTPRPIPTEVQVRVHAAGVNPVDFKTRQGGRSKFLGDLGLFGESTATLAQQRKQLHRDYTTSVSTFLGEV